MTGIAPTSEIPPLDRDWYCLQCGYNLRGLAGDPLRCPECGHLNPRELIEVPGPIIARTLREMETIPSAGIGALLMAGAAQPIFWYLWDAPGLGPWSPPVLVVGALAFVPLLWWLWSLVRFRGTCRGRSGWVGVLALYHACALIVVGVIVGPLGLATRALWSYGKSGRTAEVVAYAAAMAGLVAVDLAIILFIVRPIYGQMLVRLHALQRDVACDVARRVLRRRAARGLR